MSYRTLAAGDYYQQKPVQEYADGQTPSFEKTNPATASWCIPNYVLQHFCFITVFEVYLCIYVIGIDWSPSYIVVVS
jgi:hypothetical protein